MNTNSLFFKAIRAYSSRSEATDFNDYEKYYHRQGVSPRLIKLSAHYGVSIPKRRPLTTDEIIELCRVLINRRFNQHRSLYPRRLDNWLKRYYGSYYKEAFRSYTMS